MVYIGTENLVPLEKEVNSPRGVIVGVYIHKTLWEVKLPPTIVFHNFVLRRLSKC